MNLHAPHLNVFWVKVVLFPQSCGLFTWYIFMLLEVFISLALIRSFKWSTSPWLFLFDSFSPFLARDTCFPLNIFKTCLLTLRNAWTRIHEKHCWLAFQQTFFCLQNILLFCCRWDNPRSAYFWPSCIVVLCLFIQRFKKNQLGCSQFFGNSVVLSIGNRTDLNTCQMQFSSLLFYSVVASPLDSLYYGALMIMF